ncbi:MAG: YihY/virulence factor BrkB family protein [Bacteroidota bacterium]|nr:YihY/virulence factor BrkB family protein [Bacteroidota bacterium]
MKHVKIIGKLFKETAKKWYARDPFSESAVIAFNAIFSLPGLLVLVISLAGYFFGTEAVNGRLRSQVSEAMGTDTADQVQQMVLMASRKKDSLWATILAILTIIIGATAVFVEFQKVLNNIWEVKATTKKSGILAFLKTRLFSFGLIITIAFLLLISLVVSSLLSALSTWVLKHWSESLLVLFELLNFIISIGIIMLLFSMMFKILPDAKIKWHSVWIGAFVTALLFVVGKTALGLYFGKADPASGYGAAGSIILILLWTSYSSVIVLFGAEFTKVYSDHYYGSIPATENAVKQKTEVGEIIKTHI